MAFKFLDENGVTYLWSKITGTFVRKNTSISGATKTKITYDAKGLVTSGADATTADIAASTDKNYATDAEKTKLSNLSGTNTGDETTATIGTKVNNATAKATPVDADLLPIVDTEAANVIKKLTWANLKATIKTYFDTLYAAIGHNHDSAYIAKNGAITGATKTKITYDAKGLVTSGADATTADIADSVDKRYVTDAQKTVIGNTSGTNSGNETTTTEGALISGATAKTTPVDADMVGLMDSAASNVLKKLSWLNIKATLKTYFDTLYALTGHTHTGTYQPVDADLTAIAALAGTVGFLRKTAADTWALVTDTFVIANGAVTGATKCKITYDAKGLVTAGADLSAGDIPNLASVYLAVGVKGAASGVCPLGADTMIPSQYLPSYVDDVVEVVSMVATAPVTCTTGDIYFNSTTNLIHIATGTNTWGTGVAPATSKIYVNLATNTAYRWGGTVMTAIVSSDSVAITNAEIDAIAV